MKFSDWPKNGPKTVEIGKRLHAVGVVQKRLHTVEVVQKRLYAVEVVQKSIFQNRAENVISGAMRM